MDEEEEDGGDHIPEMLQDLSRADAAARKDRGEEEVANHNKLFAKLLEEAKRELYLGSSHVSRFSFVVSYFITNHTTGSQTLLSMIG